MLNYCMDVEKKSVWKYATPNETATELPFVCSEAGDFYACEKFFTERDHKDTYWLVYTVEGEGELLYNDNKIKLIQGSCVLIDCRSYQRYATAKGCTLWRHYWLHINGDGVRAIQQIFSNSPVAVFSPNKEELSELFELILANVKQNTIAQSLDICMSIHQILQMLANIKLNENDSDTGRRESILGTAKYIRSHYREDIKVDDLAEKVHLSKYYFIRMFRQYLGTTPYDYLLHYRITKAKELLCTTKWTTGSIGLYVGFSGESNFTAQFTRIVSQSPSKYRKEHYLIEKENI